MKRLLLKIRPLTAFGSTASGGMLFGQLCCTIKLLWGESRLQSLLQGYCADAPFAVLSDLLPSGLLPMPTIPLRLWVNTDNSAAQRKRWKKMQWLAEEAVAKSPSDWQSYAKNNTDLDKFADTRCARSTLQHNTIQRNTFTTGTGQFAPYQKSAEFFSAAATLDIHALLDDERLPIEEFQKAVQTLGQLGFGADASTGLGKFDVLSCETLPENSEACRHYLTLSACVPQSAGLVQDSSYYRILTYFGRHGAERVYGPSPFKKPILMAASGALFDCGKPAKLQWIGKGIRGHSVFPDTVHQGYAVVLPVPNWSKEDNHAQ